MDERKILYPDCGWSAAEAELDEIMGEAMDNIDICNWKLRNSLWEAFYQTECGYNARHGQNTLTYCPWCGRKINIYRTKT